MAGETNWKLKYQELKSKFMESVDLAFRLGFQQGQQQAQLDQASQAKAEADQQKQLSMQKPGADMQPGEADDSDQGASMPAGPGKGIEDQSQGSELDQHISQLESMVNKGEDLDLNYLKKTINEMKQKRELAKSAQAISEIAKALHKPAFKMSQVASHNMTSNAKQALGLQEKIVADVMAKWEQEEKNAGNDILAQLNIQGLAKKEE